VVELVVPSVADAGRIAEVINARALLLGRPSEESAAGVARWFDLPTVDAAGDMRLALDGETPVGYADVAAPEDGSPKAWVDLRALTDREDALLLLFGWAQARAAERAGPGGHVHFFVDERDAATRELLAGAGYAIVRSSFEMERALDGGLPSPSWPDGIALRPFQEKDSALVRAAHEEAFEDHWGYTPSTLESWRAYHLGGGSDTSLWQIAWSGGEIAGVALNEGRRGEDEAIGWVSVLGVRRPWRRQGLGEALLWASFAAFAAAGRRAAGLGVDTENTTGAVALYERVGMHVVRRADTWEKAA
jgi:ribosomal protein S18 acetylase RimI-like enzyme